jgi:radical SAM superfamily enzyme
VPDAVLDLLCALRDKGHEVWLELGLQSTFDRTLERVNRGHGFGEYRQAVLAARKRGLPVCTHLIVGLPGEGRLAVSTEPRASVLIHLLDCCDAPTLCIFLGCRGGCQAA